MDIIPDVSVAGSNAVDNDRKVSLVAPEVEGYVMVRSVCQDVLAFFPQKSSGIASDEFLQHINETRQNYQDLRSLYALERKGARLPKSKVLRLSEAGLSTQNIPESNCEITADLLNCLFYSYSLIARIDHERILGSTPKDEDYINLAVKVNTSFTNFFINLHEKFGLCQEDVERTFQDLFDNSQLKEDLSKKGVSGMRDGIYAAIKAYFYLLEKTPDKKIGASPLVLDRDWGIDLIAENTGEVDYFQVKAVRGSKDFSQVDVTSPKEMEAIRAKIVTEGRNYRDLRSLYGIHEYAQTQIQKGEKARAFWLEVPI